MRDRLIINVVSWNRTKSAMKPIDWQRFHDDLRAALRANVPMRNVDGSFLKTGQLDKYFSQLGSQEEQELEAAAIRTQLASDKSLPEWFAPASEIFARTGTAVPVLEGISAADEAANDVNRAMRWTFIYLLLLLVTALAGLVLFYCAGASSLEAFRQDLELPPSPVKGRSSFDTLTLLPRFMIGLAIVLATGLIALLAIGTKRFSMWLGGKRFVRYAMSSTILRIALTISRTGIPHSESIGLACDLVGYDTTARKDIEALVRGTKDDKTIEQMANCQRQSAHQCLIRMKVATPALLITLLGGSLAFIYCMIMFLPIVSMLKDMAYQTGL